MALYSERALLPLLLRSDGEFVSRDHWLFEEHSRIQEARFERSDCVDQGLVRWNVIHQGERRTNVAHICTLYPHLQTNYTFSIDDETFRFGQINYNVESDPSSGLTPVCSDWQKSQMLIILNYRNSSIYTSTSIASWNQWHLTRKNSQWSCLSGKCQM